MAVADVLAGLLAELAATDPHVAAAILGEVYGRMRETGSGPKYDALQGAMGKLMRAYRSEELICTSVHGELNAPCVQLRGHPGNHIAEHEGKVLQWPAIVLIGGGV